jgi:hypothetical protein
MPTAREIMERAGILLSDQSYVRWKLPELCGWLNEGVKAIILAKPSAKTESRALSLAEGTLQRVPTTGSPTPLALMAVTCNLVTASPRVASRVVRMTTKAQLDSQEPSWHDKRVVPYRKEVRQCVFDEANPLEFFCYPGNTGTGILEAVLSVCPPDVVPTGPADDIASYQVDVGLPEPYSPPLLDYVLHRAQSKDDTAGNAGRAAAHFAAFATAIGLKVQTEGASSPNRR